MKFFSTLFTFLIITTSYAQYDGKVTSGVVEYDNGSYEKAIGFLEEALEHKDQLNEKNLPKAYFYLGSAYYALAKDKAAKEDFSDASQATSAFHAFEEVLKIEDKKWTKKTIEQLNGLDQVLLLSGYKLITEKNYETALPIIACSVKINELSDTPNWVSYDFYGQSLLETSDSIAALSYFEKAITTYTSESTEKPDASISYVFLRASMVTLELKGDIDKALKFLDEGLAALEAEKNKLASAKNLTPEYKNTFINEWYPNAKQDLEKSKLNILLQNPEKLDQALKEFEAAVNANPDNYQLWMAYAQLMEEKNIDKAAEIYIKAIKINPTEFMGHYNLAALYINEGNRMYNMAAATHDNNTATQLKKRAAIYYEEGYKQLISCNTISPNNKTVLGHLVKISERLEKTADHKKYSEALSKL